MRALGIDPGLSGGLALVDGLGAGRSPRFVDAINIPTKGDGAKRRVDVKAVAAWLDRYLPIDVGFVERAQLMKGQDVSAGTVYMRAVGALEAVAELADLDIVPVETAVWKRALRVMPTKVENEKKHVRKVRAKSLALIRVCELFPNERERFAQKKDHNLAEATLIAVHGLRTKWETL